MNNNIYKLRDIGRILGIEVLGKFFLLLIIYFFLNDKNILIISILITKVMMLLYVIKLIKKRKPVLPVIATNNITISKIITSTLLYLITLPVFFYMTKINKNIVSIYLHKSTSNNVQEVVKLLFSPQITIITQCMLVGLIVVVGPVLEELMFREVMYEKIKNKLGTCIATITSATVFALLHFEVYVIIPLFFMGVMLALVKEIYKGIEYSIYLHIIHNSLVVLILFVGGE